MPTTGGSRPGAGAGYRGAVKMLNAAKMLDLARSEILLGRTGVESAAMSPVKISAGISSKRIGAFVVANLCFVAMLVTATVLTGAQPPLLYLVLLFSLCSTPILVADSLHGRFSILILFMPIFFVFYGMADVVAAFHPRAGLASDGVLSLTGGELAILVGALLFLIGFLFSVSAFSPQSNNWITQEWRFTPMLWVGIGLWLAGFVSTAVWQFGFADRLGSKDISATAATAVMALRTLHPVGMALIAYCYVGQNRRGLILIVLLMVAAEFALGFVADSKELAIRGLLILIMAKVLIEGSIPWRWVAVGVVLVATTFSIFYAYRFEVLQIRSQSRLEAIENLSNNIEKAMNSKTASKSGGLESFLGRVSLKPTTELIVARTGIDVSFQNGHTIGLLFNAFVPRLIWPDKPDSSVGQLFNRQFDISDDPDTYISATHLGELYWNFGWGGLIVGMFVIGAVMGIASGAFSQTERRSVTRFLLLVATIYLVLLRFEGGIALQYTMWIRSVGMILLLHLIFGEAGENRSRATQLVRLNPLGEAPRVGK